MTAKPAQARCRRCDDLFVFWHDKGPQRIYCTPCRAWRVQDCKNRYARFSAAWERIDRIRAEAA